MHRKFQPAAVVAVCAIVACVISCRNNSDKAASAGSDSTVVHDTVQTSLPRQVNAEETNDFRSLPKGSMKIAYRSTADVFTGYVTHDTLHMEGDIMVKMPPHGRKGVATTNQLWEVQNDSITIPYQIDPLCRHKKSIDSAIAMWKAGLRIRFVPQACENGCVVFVSSDYTESFVGKNGKKQTIEVGNDAWKGSIAHEIGHTLGLYHEQARRDRDTCVLIHCEEDINFRNAFIGDPYAIDVDRYNFYSIMHYSVSPCMEILKKGLPKNIPGQRDSITIGDFTTVKKIYKMN